MTRLRLTSFSAVLALAVLLGAAAPAPAADPAVIAAGAGYKVMVQDLCADYAASGGPRVDTLFGNMAQVASQARLSGKVDAIIGDAGFLNRSGLSFAVQHPLGFGRLVVACARGRSFAGPQSLLSPRVGRIALPDAKRAIYGKAAMEYLARTGILDQVEGKLTMVSTVPQAASYVMAGEVDMAFINLTHARRIESKIGSMALADPDDYSPIHIVAGELADMPHPEAARAFLRYLATDRAQAIVRAHGL